MHRYKFDEELPRHGLLIRLCIFCGKHCAKEKLCTL